MLSTYPLTDIVANWLHSGTHNYNVRRESSWSLKTNTEQFKNFIPV